MYYRYHSVLKRLINQGHLTDMKIVPEWNAISPALVLYFDNHRPMPVRPYKWNEYLTKEDRERLNITEDYIKEAIAHDRSRN